jgi:hypothetical protein
MSLATSSLALPQNEHRVALRTRVLAVVAIDGPSGDRCVRPHLTPSGLS